MIAAFLIALVGGAVAGDAAQGRLVEVPQVPRNVVASNSATAETALSSQGPSLGAITEPGVDRALLTRENVEACRRAQLGAAEPDGLDCSALLRLHAQLASEHSAEGSLLSMVGRSNTVTRAPTTLQGTVINADAVARQLSSGNVQAGPGSLEAGAIATERSSPPPGGPR